jgi:DNA-binding FadR family transcriptional regulator
MVTASDNPFGFSSDLQSRHLRRPEALAQAIEEEIVRRDLGAGTRLGTRAELREHFGVASTTVNEAIRILENRGIVLPKPGPGGGVFVAERSGWLALSQLVLDFKHSATAVAEVFAVRDALETLIDTDAAEHYRAADLRELRRLLERMGRHVNDPAAYLQANWAFHRRLAGLCVNTFARSLYEGLLDFAESELEDVHGRGDFDGTANLAVHEALLQAIASRDVERVAAAVREHNAASRVVRPA